ncbi:DeoR/GlpR family DNA-binding transcription regulator [Microterricola viridarii]|uniref:Lactose phosphotransferase system repressor n=1 Tax=Microterricola viridarii TaxID=412690 RepID=A0A1H1NIL3_9MICO|nr:DeoR/GlpR family DNA-binding transcription regulator [Microterricola viridarii]SDR98836.1 DNA-binding transcriptional regulator of sugar metabolism, DeoR/GlpR family [Microterricola viridarii]
MAIMLTSSRKAAILQRIKETGAASVNDLAMYVDVSESTIRRDLNSLSADGLLRRVRGGGSVETDAMPFHEVVKKSSSSKEKIARRAAELVSDGDVVALDIGTTTAFVARALRGKTITVITSSLAVLDELRDDQGVELVLLGGVLRRSYHSLVGSLTDTALEQLRANISIIGTSGILPDGTVMDSTGIEVPVKRGLLTAGSHTVLVADETKFPGTGLLSVCAASAINTLVTSEASDAQTLEAFRSAGSEVLFP